MDRYSTLEYLLILYESNIGMIDWLCKRQQSYSTLNEVSLLLMAHSIAQVQRQNAKVKPPSSKPCMRNHTLLCEMPEKASIRLLSQPPSFNYVPLPRCSYHSSIAVLNSYRMQANIHPLETNICQGSNQILTCRNGRPYLLRRPSRGHLRSRSSYPLYYRFYHGQSPLPSHFLHPHPFARGRCP